MWILRQLVTRLVLLSLTVALAIGTGRSAGAQEPLQGPPVQETIVRRITVEGNRRYREEQLVAAYGQQIGQPLLDEEQSRRGLDLLIKNFRVLATADFRPISSNPADGVEVRLTVVELAVDLEPRFIGNVDIDHDELLEWTGLREQEELYLYQAPRKRQQLINKYRSEGYYFVEVNVVERPGGVDPDTGEYQVPDVIFEIKEGPKVKVRDVVVHGNDHLPDRGWFIFRRGLKKLSQIDMRGPRLFNWFSKKLVQETLDADIIAMREVYRDYGFLDVVVQLKELEFTEDRKWVTIHIEVDEGGRYTIGSIGLEAVEFFEDPSAQNGYGARPAELIFPKEELLGLVEQKVGDVYERRNQFEDERELRQFYGNQGYVEHRSLPVWDRWQFLEPELVFESDRPVVHVTYRVAQGRQIFIREITVSGNLHTQDRVIRREIDVEPGQRADLERIERSRQRIQATGFFSDQRDINHIEPLFTFNDTTDPNWKDLEYRIEEGQVLTFNLSGGISSNAGAFGIISLRERNFDVTNMPRSPWSLIDDIASRRAFHGAGQELLIEAAPGTEVSRYRITFREPDIFRRHQRRIGMSLSAAQLLRIFDSHDEERAEYGIEFSRQLTLDSALYTGFRFGSVTVDNIATGGEPSIGNPLTVPRALKEQEGKNDLAYISLGYRLRSVDNFVSPHDGYSFTFDNRFYGGGIGSAFDFVRQEITADYWDKLNEDPDVVSPYYHFGLGLGVAWPFGDTAATPYTERFFLGGQRTLRGFRFRGVGPNEQGFPAGGSTMLYGTVEYRHPLVKQIQPGTYRELEQLQAGLFLDFGILDPVEFMLDPDELRVSAGFLFGISIPIPITFSFGWPIQEGDGDQKRVLGFDIGF